MSIISERSDALGGVMESNARLWHPWLRITRVLRSITETRWDAETLKQVKPEIRKALTEKQKIARAGGFN